MSRRLISNSTRRLAGSPFETLSIVDEHTRQALGGRVDYSITAEDLIDQLDVLVIERGTPSALCMDNGPVCIHLYSSRYPGMCYRGGIGVYPTRATLAKRVHRIIPPQSPGRTSHCHPVLLSEPFGRHHRRVEGGLQHDQAAFIKG